MHASLRAIGSIEVGAAGVVQALERAVGSTGTLLMDLGARDDFDWVNTRPEQQRADLLADAPPFDSHATPADPDVGVLAEVFRQLPGTVVNDHPGPRLAGSRPARRAAALGRLLRTWFDPGALRRVRGKVLRVGADPDTVTLLHLAENLVELPSKRRVLRHHKVVTPNRTVLTRTVNCLDDTDGIVDWPGEDYFDAILHDYLTHHGANIGRVGNAHSELIDSAELLDHAVNWMATNFNSQSSSP